MMGPNEIADAVLTEVREIASKNKTPLPAALRELASGTYDGDNDIWTEWRRAVVTAAAMALSEEVPKVGMVGCLDAIARDRQAREGIPRNDTLNAIAPNPMTGHVGPRPRIAETSPIFALAFGAIKDLYGKEFERAK